MNILTAPSAPQPSGDPVPAIAPQSSATRSSAVDLAPAAAAPMTASERECDIERSIDLLLDAHLAMLTAKLWTTPDAERVRRNSYGDANALVLDPGVDADDLTDALLIAASDAFSL